MDAGNQSLVPWRAPWCYLSGSSLFAVGLRKVHPRVTSSWTEEGPSPCLQLLGSLYGFHGVFLNCLGLSV